MKRTQAEALLKTDFRTLSYEEFLKYRVKIVDALRESEAEYGYERCVRLYNNLVKRSA